MLNTQKVGSTIFYFAATSANNASKKFEHYFSSFALFWYPAHIFEKNMLNVL